MITTCLRNTALRLIFAAFAVAAMTSATLAQGEDVVWSVPEHIPFMTWGDDRLEGAVALMKVSEWDKAASITDKLAKQNPEDLQASYLSGISHREMAKLGPALLMRKQWNLAYEYLDRVIATDSSFQDVLMQKARLLQYDNLVVEATALGESQVRIRPDLDHAFLELFRAYEYLVFEKKDEELGLILRLAKTPMATLFEAERLRRKGEFEQAERMLLGLLGSSPDMPAQPIYTILARINYQTGQPDDGESYVLRSIDEIEYVDQAAFAFDEIKYLLEPAEYEAYQLLADVDEFKAFFRDFWLERDPAPASPLNARITEHYRRWLIADRQFVHHGVRRWHTDPDQFADLDKPDTYKLNARFNDKGLIYLRFGEPNQKIASVAEYNVAGIKQDEMDYFRTSSVSGVQIPYYHRPDGPWSPNESWRYFEPRLDFHFLAQGAPTDWRLTPILRNVSMLVEREGWGQPYARLAQTAIQFLNQMRSITAEGGANVESRFVSTQLEAYVGDFTEWSEKLKEASRDAAEVGLGEDRHTWPEDTQPLNIPMLPVAFRGPDGQTRLDIYHGIPVGTITQSYDEPPEQLAIRLGVSMHDTLWAPEVEQQVMSRHAPSDSPNSLVINKLSVLAPPDHYQVGFSVEPMDSKLLAAYRFRKILPDFSSTDLVLSDVVLAYNVEAAEQNVASVSDLKVVANPFSRFAADELVYACFEVYNLLLDADDRTRYDIEYTLTPEEKRGGLFRRKKRGPSITLTASNEGSTTSPVEFVSIEVAGSDPGEYELTVRVTDVVSGRTASRSVALSIEE